ncbi:hypothetical protein JRO89_XSUnG0163400 [Xanthoceras sorbifolium]|uniref:DUF674 family protein n=1 Tax=Xanthoceras sorbifolium TaxID=99658 RepID=A0ABQ8GXR3_9ROSI|nr:hypothetical protein JRO89_XSUnG0163400 [Xanthoceras sorbifolium]
MAEKPVEGISLKALVDKENNRVIFAEADEDFVDILLSFLTMPMGTIIRLVRSKRPAFGIGCMNNLYESIENLDVLQFQTKECKTMLLDPINAAAAECKRLKFKIGEPLKYFICNSQNCTLSGYKLLSHYRDVICVCRGTMTSEIELHEKVQIKGRDFDARDSGAFVKGLSRLIISDELEIMPASIETSLSLLSKLGVMDGTATEECNVNVGVDEVLTLLKCSLLSKTPLTETLLKHNPVPELGRVDFDQGSYIKSRIKGPASNVCGKIRVKLIVSKSKNMVCFAEASEDFVSLLFSFLTVPLGYVVKEMHSGTSKGCITHLYNSVEELDAKQYLKSSKHKEMLLSPKLAPNFTYENHSLGIEENKHPPYYHAQNSYGYKCVVLDETLISSRELKVSTLNVMDPKCGVKGATSGGFVTGPANFTVTDNLVITQLSPISCLSLLNKMKVLFSDVEEHFVHVGTEEALQLLVASFVSESALTNAFLREPNPEY